MTIAGYDKGPVSRARASVRRGVEAVPDSDGRLYKKNLRALMILPISVLAVEVAERGRVNDRRQSLVMERLTEVRWR